MTQDTQAPAVSNGRVEELLADAASFFEEFLWESGSSSKARDVLARNDLEEKVIRDFGVGYAPIGPDVLMDHLSGRGYSIEELLAAGLATLSVRGRAHIQFRSRLTFPVRDRDGRILGFAGLGTHLGPSWPQWITSPDTTLYRRSEAVFGIDRAATKIASSRTAVVRPDCVEVLKAHQDRKTNAVTVHTTGVTREQMNELANGIRGGVEALELDLPPGISIEQSEPAAPKAQARDRPDDRSAEERSRNVNLKRVGLVSGTALAAMNAWTGAPLLAVWVGSQMQSGRLLSMRGVVTVLLVLAILELVLLWALTWLNAKYDEITGRPLTASQTSPWHRAKRGDRVEDIRSRYGLNAPEKAVAACVAVGVLVFEVWFFFFAGSSLPGV